MCCEEDMRTTINNTRLGTGGDLVIQEPRPAIVIAFQLRNDVVVSERCPVAGAHFDHGSPTSPHQRLDVARSKHLAYVLPTEMAKVAGC